MKTKKIHKRNLRTVFRNVWLFSMLAFAIASVIWVGVSWIFKLTGFQGYAPLVIFSVIVSVGGLSFLIWISILIFSNKPLKIIDILLGISLAVWGFFTMEGVLDIFRHGNNLDENFGISTLTVIILLLTFGAVCYFWIKTNKIIIKALIILILIGTYFLGRAYAMREWTRYLEARSYFNQAAELQNSTLNTPLNEAIVIRKQALEYWKKSTEINTNSLPLQRDYYKAVYDLYKEMNDYEEKLMSGEIVVTSDEYNKYIREWDLKMQAIIFERLLPSWTTIFNVQDYE